MGYIGQMPEELNLSDIFVFIDRKSNV